MGKHCCYGLCNSDSRYAHLDHMKNVYFIPFPKPKSHLTKCNIWIQACHREGFTVESVSKDTYTCMCSKHFIGGAGPTDINPEPIPATASKEQVISHLNH